MNITGIINPAANSLSQQKVGDNVGIAVFNKALNTQVATAVQLIHSAMKPVEQSTATDKSNTTLGRHIDVKA